MRKAWDSRCFPGVAGICCLMADWEKGRYFYNCKNISGRAMDSLLRWLFGVSGDGEHVSPLPKGAIRDRWCCTGRGIRVRPCRCHKKVKRQGNPSGWLHPARIGVAGFDREGSRGYRFANDDCNRRCYRHAHPGSSPGNGSLGSIASLFLGRPMAGPLRRGPSRTGQRRSIQRQTRRIARRAVGGVGV